MERLRHAVRADARLAQEGRDRRSHQRLRAVADRAVGEQADVGRDTGVRREASQRRERLTARRAPRQPCRRHRHIEHAEPRVGHPLAGDAGDVVRQLIAHG